LGDGTRLQQVVWNLITNAVKFTPEEGSIEVIVERIDSSAQIRVKDNGQGIAPEFLPHIFDRFAQADRKGEVRAGLGLGLAIVRELVDAHHGTVQAESAGEGWGATFTVTLPTASFAGVPAAASKAHAHSSKQA
jgi:signal transduction histidine kinase